ncbi:oligomeric Golgi complex subunit 8 [Tricharina praecox]|uniref:oligomeric Golgi complex subunit 8 n=1 Tax=Tricharina praecox TaxID=43433 RepID=UPI00221F5213|nr:oligomeric Golgi complex subunit 8 [Tricharina praecox]KAI5848964.1 oligomeric Golgi complex subunit 8 [Tricharina praecox]
MTATTDDPLLELLLPHIPASAVPSPETTNSYLSRLTSLPLSTILTTEPSSLATTHHTLSLSLQSLASRNHKAIITSSSHLSTLPATLSTLSTSLQHLESALPSLTTSLHTFTSTYTRDSPPLHTRHQNALLHSNLDRLLDILQLPSLLQSLIAAQNYPSALDTLSHVRRLQTLYPTSPVVTSVHTSCEALQRSLTSSLIGTLRAPLKLPVAMKTVGFLRRTVGAADERDVRGVFLACRHAHLLGLLAALEPLRELADEEVAGGGVQAERYLKRWLEVFREQSFGVQGMYRSIFPGSMSPATSAGGTATPTPTTTTRPGHSRTSSSLSTALADDDVDGGGMPDPVAAYEARLVEMLVDVLRRYLGKVLDKGVRESLLTQVMYASGSLGRLGGEFAGVLVGIEGVFEGEGEDGAEVEYVAVVERQKVLAGRLEATMATGR